MLPEGGHARLDSGPYEPGAGHRVGELQAVADRRRLARLAIGAGADRDGRLLDAEPATVRFDQRLRRASAVSGSLGLKAERPATGTLERRCEPWPIVVRSRRGDTREADGVGRRAVSCR